MAENKNTDFDIDQALQQESEDIGNFEIDDVDDNDFVNNNFNNQDTSDVDEIVNLQTPDFANFDIDDFDAALNSYQAARAGKTPNINPQPVQQPVVNEQPTQALKPVQDVEPQTEKVEQKLPKQSPQQTEPKVEYKKPEQRKINPSTVNESGFKGNSSEKQQDIMNWYSGKLSDKAYRISINHMPEFLDSDKTIRVVHVEVDSAYGWNVFFDNGVFMSLKDLKEYQERHGEMPCQDGKFVYGNKTSSFERILKVVVYERPRYFSYKVK